MLTLRRPSDEALRRFLQDQSDRPFTYEAVGATATSPPRGFVLDRTRTRLGDGEETFAAAKEAHRDWAQFRLGWAESWPPRAPIREGGPVAILARVAGFWSINACRIVYVIEETRPVARYGFAYGTLPDHVATGEERFLVERDGTDGGVWLDVLAFSRPRHVLSKVAYFWMRRKQGRFGREAPAAMRRAMRALDGPIGR